MLLKMFEHFVWMIFWGNKWSGPGGFAGDRLNRLKCLIRHKGQVSVIIG